MNVKLPSFQLASSPVYTVNEFAVRLITDAYTPGPLSLRSSSPLNSTVYLSADEKVPDGNDMVQ